MSDATHPQIYNLTDEQRLEAKNEARRIVVAQYGNEPTIEQFQRPLPLLPNRADYVSRTVSEYPQWLVSIIGVFMVIVFIAAALPSLFRLYRVGYDYFYMGIANDTQAVIVGVSTFLLAEFLIVLSTVAMRVLFKSWVARGLFIIPIVLGLAMAFVGNWTITQPHDAMSWLETIVPPIAVLFTAFIGEQMILHSIKTRYSNERAYQKDRRDIEHERREQQQNEKLEFQNATTAWHDATKAPEKSSHWLSAYANALRNQLITANDFGSGKTKRMEYLNSLEREQWVDLIRYEIEAEQWFSEENLSQAKTRLASDSNFTQEVSHNPRSVVMTPPVIVSHQNGNGSHI